MPRAVSFIRSLPRAERKYKHFYDKRTLGFYERLAKSPLSSPFLENRLLNVDSSATSGENQDFFRVLDASCVLYNRTEHNQGFSIC